MNDSVDKVANQAQDTLDGVAQQARKAGQRGMRAAGDAAQQAFDAASDATQSLMTYTKQNPAKALLIAAASGAVLLALFRNLSPTRD